MTFAEIELRKDNNLVDTLRKMLWRIRKLEEWVSSSSGGYREGDTIINNTFTGNTPIGGIIMWSGNILNIPGGWNLCDGTNTTPDLRDSFIVGAGTTYAIGDTGGTATKDVSHTHGPGSLETDSDTHNHTASSGSTGNESAHTHGVGSLTMGFPSTSQTTNLIAGFVAALGNHIHTISGTSGTGSSHNHGYGSIATDNDTHDHTVDAGVTASGGSITQDILPPYYALAFIMRTS